MLVHGFNKYVYLLERLNSSVEEGKGIQSREYDSFLLSVVFLFESRYVDRY